jgi:hypothetical protein
MSHHISDDLPRLLTGEATRDETGAAAAHLRSCPDCQQELVSAVVAHASLSSAMRFAPEVVATPEAELPTLAAVFATAHEEAGRSKKGRRFIAVAAAAVVLAGAGVTIAETAGSGGGSTSRTVVLDAFGVGTQDARVTLGTSGTMGVDASALPRLDRQHFYEVWLTNPARTRLQAVGSIGADNRAQLTISPNVMRQYSAIEVSVQGLRQTAYSGTSVLRGTYG